MKSPLAAINQRVSVRSYKDEKISEPVLQELLSFISDLKRGPFGTTVRFLFLDNSGGDKSERKKLGTYGMITGDQFYIAGAASKGEFAEIDYGYCLEQIILKATELGLGTCWLGGTLNRSAFDKKARVSQAEILPAVTPLGIPSDHTPLKTVIIQNLLQVRKRKDFGTIFFDGSVGVPLEKKDLGPWVTVLEAVRSCPSASNKQPWRIIKQKDHFHFYLDFDRVYNSVFQEFSVQKLDAGIALCHFELVAKELNLPGKWEIIADPPATNNLMYISSWIV